MNAPGEGSLTALPLQPAPEGTCPLRWQYFHGTGTGSPHDTLGSKLHTYFAMSTSMPCGMREKRAATGDAGWAGADYVQLLLQDGVDSPTTTATTATRAHSGGSRGDHVVIDDNTGYLPKVRGRQQQQQQSQAVAGHDRSLFRTKKRGSLYNTSISTADRYRRIEDLALFLNTGTITEDTMYFRDPMQKRLAEDANMVAEQQQQQQCVVAVETSDPRFAVHWNDEKKENQRVTSIIPKKAKDLKRSYDQTTGAVKPYAFGRAFQFQSTGNVASHCMVENAMDAYVTTMQCQRPTKGLYAQY